MESIESKMILYSRTMNVGFRFICIDKDLCKSDKDEILYDLNTFWSTIDNRMILLNRRHLIVRLMGSKKKVCMYKIFDASAGTITRSTCSLEGLSFDSNLAAFIYHIVPQFYFDSTRLNFNSKERDEGKDIEYFFKNDGKANLNERIVLREELFNFLETSDNNYSFVILENDMGANKPFQIITLNGILPLELKRYV